VHDGSSLSHLNLLPIFFKLHEAVVSSSAGGQLLIMFSAWASFPPPRLTPFPSGSRHHPTSLSDTHTIYLARSKNSLAVLGSWSTACYISVNYVRAIDSLNFRLPSLYVEGQGLLDSESVYNLYLPNRVSFVREGGISIIHLYRQGFLLRRALNLI
jgi:hypothetical protein